MSDRQQIVDDLRTHLPGALFALDFDGVLAPIVPDPETSRPVEGIRPALEALVARGARVAVVTGRDAETVLRLSGLGDLPGLEVQALYGMQQWYDGELHTPSEPPGIAALRMRLGDLVARRAGGPGVWVEDKGLSLVVHARTAADPDAALAPLQNPVRALAGELGLEVHPGRAVLEVRVPGYDKGNALLAVVTRVRPSAVFVAGDDLGDVAAMLAARSLRDHPDGIPTWTVGVNTADVPELAAVVDLSLDGPPDVVQLLTAIAE